MSTTNTAIQPLPDYAPVPRSALGPALNEQGYYVGRVERNLYWVTDGTYQSAFLTTKDGVVLFDAPAPGAGQRPRQAGARGDLQRPPHSEDRRRAHRARLAWLEPLARQHLHPL